MTRPSKAREVPHPFDLDGIDRVRLRHLLEPYAEMTDEELVDRLLEEPVAGISTYASTEKVARNSLLNAVRDERSLMALGEAMGHTADPRYLARTTGRASLGELYRQMDELVEQTEALAEEARDLRERFRARMEDPDSDDDPAREVPKLVRALAAVWANARRIDFATRKVVGGLPPWERDEGEEWKDETE